MQTKQITTALAVILGLLFLVAAVLYVTQPASALPGFLPGHDPLDMKRHVKHGVLAAALAVVCFVAARFFYGGPAGAEA